MLRDMTDDEKLAWALDSLQELSFMPGFPESGAGIRLMAKAFLEIVGDQPANNREQMYSVELSKGVDTVYPEIPADDTVEWLLTEIVSRYERFPMPIQIRALYEEKYLPADGRVSTEMGIRD